MKGYGAYFGQYAIHVQAENPASACQKVLLKWNAYKNGSTKKEYIREKISQGFYVWEEYLKDGFYRIKNEVKSF